MPKGNPAAYLPKRKRPPGGRHKKKVDHRKPPLRIGVGRRRKK